MKRLLFPLLLTLLPLAAVAQNAASLQIEATGAPELSLHGKDARQQLLVTGTLSDGALRSRYRRQLWRVLRARWREPSHAAGH